jgi:hypothetical protein
MRTTSLLRSILTVTVIGLLAVAVQPAVVETQGNTKLDAEDEDFGRKLRHPGTRLIVPNSGRKSPDPALDAQPAPRSFEARPRWEYHWFDHPVPSYQYFQQPRTYTWRYRSYPGITPYLDPGNQYHYYYYYHYDYPPSSRYYPPGYYWRYGTNGWYGW